MRIIHCLLMSLLVVTSGISGVTMATGSSYSDDTELFVYDFAKAGDFRPKVLFVFDNSGSMQETTLASKGDYDPGFNYPRLPNNDDGSNSYIYYSTLASPPSDLTDNNKKRFDVKRSACASGTAGLRENGIFTSIFWNYTISGKNTRATGTWSPLSSATAINVVDCQQDFISGLTDNSGFTASYNSVDNKVAGYPINTNAASQNISKPWSVKASSYPVTGGNQNVIVYSANYLRWYHSADLIMQSRLAIARRALKELVLSTPAVDFGLAVFNANDGNGPTNKNGGRVIRKVMAHDAILASTTTGAQDIIDKVYSLKADTWTPLCETMYEAYRYFGGAPVYFGDDDPNRVPARDANAEVPAGTYLSPYDKCSNNAYLIYLTDGAPTNDTAANGLVIDLLAGSTDPNKNSYSGTVGYGSNNSQQSYLAALAGYMKNNDVNAAAANKQNVTTFTVGFGDDAIKGAGNLLAETARRGGGKYYPATNATQLNEALKSSLLAILKMNTSLVSPAITTNNFDRTRSLNNIYYAMFEPGAGPRWKGNLKKLMLDPAKGYVVDQAGLPAVASDGTILASAKTYWSSSTDGNRVSEGGAQEMLSLKANRRLYVTAPTVNQLHDFTKTTLDTLAGGSTALRTFMGLEASDDLEQLINWSKGLDAFDDDKDPATTIRDDILGDPLHSRPLVINYGCSGSGCKPDLRIVMGTNAGFLHMFKDSGSQLDESWAIMPYPFLANQKTLRENQESAAHLYGVDSSAVVVINEKVKDGHVKLSDGDKVWLFTGLRGGGSAYYAFDISNPEQPILMWQLDDKREGFELLGQTWSIPEVAFIPGHVQVSSNIPKPVLVFSGGYDQSKSALGQGVADSRGTGIYIVDAETGTLLRSFSPADAGQSNTNVSDMIYSMPGSVTVLDSDSDGITDRIYASDTGGHIWRVDMKGIDKSKWTAIKFASLGNSHITTNKSLADDRRFFSKPVLVRTINKGWQLVEGNYVYGERPFDAVLIGSGDRNRPASELVVKNAYVMLRDYTVKPTLFGSDAEVPPAITMADLYDVTIDPFIDKSEQQIIDIQQALTSKMGWTFWLSETGEKSMGAGVVLQGQLYFTSFFPRVQNFQQCTIQSIGTMRQYMINMHYGSSFKKVVDSSGNEVTERYVEVQNKVADDLVIHGGDDGLIRIIGGSPGSEVILKNEDRCAAEGDCAQGAQVAEMDMSPKKIYLYEGER